MSTILFTWELGGSLGHIIPMVPMARGLAEKGHKVYVALRQLTRAAAAFGNAKVFFLQAPYESVGQVRVPHMLNHAQILANVGWGDDGELVSHASAWRNLYSFVKPDLIVFDYSPTALLASRCLPEVRRAVTGLGFFCPPDVAPLPVMVDHPVDAKRLADSEQWVLERANRLLRRWDQPPLERLGQLYSQVDETLLATFPELDHYGPHRPAGTTYWGPSHAPGGKAPNWPDASGKRVYAYLKNFPMVEQVLQALADLGGPTLVLADGIHPALRKKFASPALRFEEHRLDLALVGRQCDLAVHNANHGTLCQLLLAGKPMLQIPLSREQSMLAKAVCRTGAAEMLHSRAATTQAVRHKLEILTTEARYAESARAFAHMHADYDPLFQQGQMLERLLELAQARALPVAPSRGMEALVA